MKTINIDILKKAFDNIINNYQSIYGENIPLKEDYYNYISNIYNIDDKLDVTIGSLFDDLQKIEEAAEDKDIIGYHLVWLSSILRYLGEK